MTAEERERARRVDEILKRYGRRGREASADERQRQMNPGVIRRTTGYLLRVR